jgi:hypothetical protein
MAISLSITGTSTIAQATLPTLINNIAVVATDSADPTPTFSYSWHLLSKPTGSTASLTGNTTNSPDLINIDVWGNYRLFCIVQNTDNSAITETDPLKAPSSCFFTVQVQSSEAGLTKPASGERNWQTQYHAAVDKIEDLTEIINNNLLEDGTFGASVSDATATSQGVVELATSSEILNGTSNGTTAPLSIQPSELITALNAISQAEFDNGRDLDSAIYAAMSVLIKNIPLETIYDFSKQVTDGEIPALVNNDSIIYNSGTGYFEGIQHKLSTQKDVNLTSPANKALLRYDTATSKWVDDSILTVLGRGSKYIPYSIQGCYGSDVNPFVGDIAAPVGTPQQCLFVYRNDTDEDLIIEGFDVNVGHAHVASVYELCSITGADAATRNAAMRANAWTRTGHILTTTYDATRSTASGYMTFSKFTLAAGEYVGIIANTIDNADRRIAFQIKAFWELTK